MAGSLRKTIYPALALGIAAAALAGCSSGGTSSPPQAGGVASQGGGATPRFRSIADAADYVRSRVDVGVLVPRGLPDGTRLASAPVSTSHRKGEPASGQIRLTLPRGRDLTLEYGGATFDGCGPLHPRAVRIRSSPAVLDVDRSRSHPFSTVVWPATHRDLTGRYAVAGEVDPGRALDLARSMAPAHARKAAGAGNGC